MAIPAGNPECQGFPNPFASRANPTSSNQQKQGGPSSSRSLVLLYRHPAPSPHMHQEPTTHLQSNVAVRRPPKPIRHRVVSRRLPPKQWEVMQALLNPEFESSAPLLKHCYETYQWTKEDAVSFAISGVPEPRTYLVLPIRPRRYQANRNINPCGTPLPDSIADRAGKTDLEASPYRSQKSERSVEVEVSKAFPLSQGDLNDNENPA